MKRHPRKTACSVLLSLFLFTGMIFVPGCSANTGDEPVDPPDEEDVHIVDIFSEVIQNPVLDISEDWEPLLEINEDFVGWIMIDGTSIDYPVMQADDNEKYLTRNFTEEPSPFGTPFFDYRCTLNPQCRNLILYGHAARAAGMFAQLDAYESQEHLEEYPYILLQTLYQQQRYQIFAVLKVPTTGSDLFNYTQCDFDSADEYRAFLDTAMERSLIDSPVAVGIYDRILTIQTCTNESEADKLVVMAVLLNE